MQVMKQRHLDLLQNENVENDQIKMRYSEELFW